MNILAINGSPHRDGNTVTLINEILRGARESGHQGRIAHLVDLDLDYCNWCGDCWGPTPGVCPIDDGFAEHLAELFAADAWIVATPSVNRSVTGYMKNWLDRLGASQLSYVVDENRKATMTSRVPAGKRAIVVVQGCTTLFQETSEPIHVVLKVLGVEVVETLVVTRVGQTVDDTVDQKPEAMRQALEIGSRL